MRIFSGLTAGLAVLMTLVGSTSVLAETIDPDDDGSQYIWSENTGWINAEPLGNGGPGMRVLDTRVGGWMWSENTGWISLSCGNRGSCSSVNYGVTNDGAGNLAGFASGENVGWISFACENTSSCATADYGVSINSSGEFSGWAWGENVGWMSFSCVNTNSCSSVDYRLKTESTFLPVNIFADGFESGDTSAWSGSVP